MKRTDINQAPNYFDRYINLIDDISLNEAFQESLDALASFDWVAAEAIGTRTYAPNKWTIADILQHLIDWERILTFRTLVYVREAGVSTASMDENLLAKNAASKPKTIATLVEELTLLRQSTRLFFKDMDNEDLQKVGKTGRLKMSVLAMGFTMLGHQMHHFSIIRERYLNLH